MGFFVAPENEEERELEELKHAYSVENKDPLWMRNKENIILASAGVDLNKIVETKKCIAQSEQSDLSEQYFEERLQSFMTVNESSSHDTVGELFSLWRRYLSWTAHQNLSSRVKYSNLLARCLIALQCLPQLQNNKKYIDLWIKYSRMTASALYPGIDTPTKIVKNMRKLNIGEKIAKFYAFAAIVIEAQGNYEMAYSVYEKGLEKGATPRTLLHRQFDFFKIRMLEHKPEASEAKVKSDRKLKVLSRKCAKAGDRLKSIKVKSGNPALTRPNESSKTESNIINHGIYEDISGLDKLAKGFGSIKISSKQRGKLATFGKAHEKERRVHGPCVSKENKGAISSWEGHGLKKPGSKTIPRISVNLIDDLGIYCDAT